MRFLMARSMEPKKAAKMFVEWQKWRASFVPLGFISDSEVSDELKARKIYLQGLSKDGHPVLIGKASKHFPAKDQLQFKKFVVYMLDKTLASALNRNERGTEKFMGVLDLQQITYKNNDARGVITAIQFFQAYYPERLAKCYVLYMPKYFVSIWKMISRFFEKETLQKIVIVHNQDEMREFIREIGEEVLPEEYGGRAKLVPIQDVIPPPVDGLT
ncbi:hypothetical protein U1Q18_029720 [Sarracenia purpurea var. burkii]